MTGQFRRWDSTEYLKTEEDLAEYLDVCMDVGGRGSRIRRQGACDN